ncbi:MAG: flippase-like domain-containing protein [Actinomycetota bacterium]|nr:flippase-like domain-containing protein [Actinomycetota bacterium]
MTASRERPVEDADGAGPLTAADQKQAAEAGRNLRNGMITLVVLVVLVVGLLLAVPGLHGVGKVVANMRVGWVALAIGFEILSCVSYIIAFLQVFERAPIRWGARVAMTELAFGTAVSLGGAGSLAIGAWLLRERGVPAARIAERSAVLFLLTSAVNILTLTLAGFGLWLGVLPGPRNPLLSLVPGLIGLSVFTFFLALPAISEHYAKHRQEGHLRVLLLGTAASVRATRTLLFTPDWRLVGAFGFLWFDIAVLWACFQATGHAPPLAALVLAYQIGYLSNLIPIPGGIGILDGSFVGLFVLYGVSATAATAATVVYHAIALWVPATWGTIAFIILRRTRHRPVTPRPTRAERAAERTSKRS